LCAEAVLLALRNTNSKKIPFSPRLERRAIQLACAMSLPSYFQNEKEIIEIDNSALNFAIKFFVDEAEVRSMNQINSERILTEIGEG
jgi:hypothetical protein